MSPLPLDPGERRAQREAAAWLARNDRGLTPAEQDEFLQWLAADGRHKAWLARHRSGWERLDGVANWRPRDDGAPNPDVLASPARRFFWTRAAMLAVAAAMIGSGVLWLNQGHRAVPPSTVAAPVASGYERRTLEDSSVVELNHGAEIEVNMSATERRVVLRHGEALFTVARDPSRPFVVRAHGVDVRAVGTVFNVRLEAEIVEVLVTEGKVQVAPPISAVLPPVVPAALPLVAAGEQAVVSLVAPTPLMVAPASEAALQRLRAWRPQLLDFSSTPLGEAIAEFNRRNRRQIRLADPTSASIPIVASIQSDNIDGFVRLVATAVGLQAELRGEYEIVLRRVK